MSDMEEFLHDLDRVTDALKAFERASLKEDQLNRAIAYYEAKSYFMNTWCPKEEKKE